jgi:hypothetical protein
MEGWGLGNGGATGHRLLARSSPRYHDLARLAPCDLKQVGRLVESSDTFDVVVVGGGGSGLAAACTAAQHGARVLLLEKQPHLGGTTGLAVGSFTAAGTSWQQAAGIDDTPEAHAEDAAKFAAPAIEARNHVQLRRYFLQRAADTLHWLGTLGLSFYGPSPEPPNRVPRMHNVIPGAKAYIAALQAALLHHGGRAGRQ